MTTASKKSSVAKSVELDMEFTKTTKNFHRFDNKNDGAAIRNVYVDKGAIDAKEGTVVTVTVKPKV